MICDLAQFYNILNWQELQPTLVATLVVGLPSNSRVKKKMSGYDITLSEMLLALAVDGIHLLLWQRTKDGSKNRNRPESLYKKLLNLDVEKTDELQVFDSPEEFDKWYKSKMR